MVEAVWRARGVGFLCARRHAGQSVGRFWRSAPRLRARRASTIIRVYDAGTKLRGIAGQAPEGILLELNEATRVEKSRLNSMVYIHRAPLQYPQMERFGYATSGGAFHPDG